ncbi:unnamed protein product, partial [Coregonus sp. 'balchen']
TWAEDPPIDQYGLNGGLVCLAVAELPDQLKRIQWKFQNDIIVDDKEISPKYKEKVDYNPVNQTLCIKNLTDTDSGIYIANAQKIDWTDSTSSYRLKVLEAVPIPAMQVTYSNSSTGLCNITVNCSGWMFSVCNGGQCTLYQDSLSFSEVNITVSSGNGFIQCIVNNHAVVPEVDIPVSALPGRPEPQNTPGSEVTSIYDTAGRPGAAVPAVAGGEEVHPGDKEYTSPEERTEPQSPSEAEPTSVFYSTLQKPAAAQRHPVGKGNNQNKPDTVYCTIGDYPSILLRDPLMLP